MKPHFVVFVIVFLSSYGFAQETYKCKINGSLVFQDKPCPGVGRYSDSLPEKTAKSKTDTNSGQLANTTPPLVSGVQEAAKPQSDLERQKTFLAKRAKEKMIADYKEQIEKTEAKISQLHASMNIDLANVEVQRSYAKNNLAGATYLQSLATEKQAITSRYESEINTQRESLKNLRVELAKAEK